MKNPIKPILSVLLLITLTLHVSVGWAQTVTVLRGTGTNGPIDGFIRSEGTLLDAWNLGLATNQTRNGVTFVGTGSTSPSGTNWNTSVAGAPHVDAGLGGYGSIDPLFFSELYGNSPVTIFYTNLNPNKVYAVQIMHGEPRAGFMATFANNDFIISGLTSPVPSFVLGNLIGSENPPNTLDRAIVDVQLTGTTFFTYEMKNGSGRGPSIAGFQVRDITSIVTTTADSGVGSLRYAVTNNPPGTTITFAPNLSGATILLTGGELLLNKNLTIDASALPGGVAINANQASRSFQVLSGQTVVLTALTISNGVAGGGGFNSGGGILNAGSLTLNRCTVAGNQAGFTGGGVESDNATLNVNQCTFFSNTGTRGGGGIYIAGGTGIVNQSTFTLNSAPFLGGGGGNGGAGISVYQGTLKLDEVTIVGNSASRGGGINEYQGTVSLRNTIITGNSATTSGPDIFADTAFAATGVNLTNGVPPLLAPLGNYGGPTPTMPPLFGSPAIDGCTSGTGFSTDQRGPGFPRVMNFYADIGAAEALVPSIPNASFEADTFTNWPGYASGNGGVITGWAISGGGSGLNPTPAGSPFANNGIIPAGANAAFIQMGGSLSTTISGLTPGASYRVSFRANGRSDTSMPTPTWSLNGGAFVPFTAWPAVGGSNPYYPNSAMFAATGSTAALVISNYSVADSAVVMDAFTITNAPASVVVTTANDSGPGSLRQAVVDVAFSGTITFTNTLSGSTITLSNGPITLNKNLTINASALPGGIAINGNHTSQIFNVASGATNVLTALTITNGFAGDGGGIANHGNLTLNRCTLAGNSATSTSGAILNFFATLTLNQCTLAGNSAATLGGAIYTFGGTLTLDQSTVTGNTSGGNGGGINNEAQLVLKNSIVAGNSAPSFPDVYIRFGGTLALNGVNLTNGAPLLAPLGNYGGPTPTMPPLPGSPAIDGCTSGTGFATDQRGFPRIVGPFADIGAVEFQDASPVVLNNNDAGPGSLRYAVTYCPAGSTITFTNTLSGQTILLTNGQIALNKNLIIDGSALANGIQINGGGNSRIFSAGQSNLLVALTGLTLTNGVADRGGALFINSAVVTVNRCIMAGNTANGILGNIQGYGYGGCIYNSGLLVVSNSTFYNNLATDDGGAILNDGGGVARLNQSTLAGNLCNGLGGVGGLGTIFAGSIVVNQSTITGNSAPLGAGGIRKDVGSLAISNSIVAGNIHSNNNFEVQGAFTDAYNFTNGNPQLASLGNYGGPTPTMPPLPGSPVIDGCTSGTIFTNDQRGFSRIVGPFADIGAVEFQDASTVVVTNANSGPGSLRYVVTYCPVGSTITFAPNLSGQTILLTNGEIVLNRNLHIDASSLLAGVTVSGNNSSRIFSIRPGAVLSMAGLSFTSGNGQGAVASGYGGAILNDGTFSAMNCTFVSNSAPSGGGGVSGPVTLVNCTLTGNYGQRGGAIDQGAPASLTHCTVTGNSAGVDGGGVLNYFSLLTVTNSIIAGNTPDDISNQGGTVNFGGANITSFAGLNASNVAPRLAPLGYYGGSTQTMPPLPGSPTIDAAALTIFTTDQRDYPRPAGAGPDIGAVEGVVPPPRFLAEGGPWKYLANGSDQGTAWRGTNFNDSTWSTGVARLGFGGDGEVTTIGNAASNFVTFYFRQSFNVANAASVSNLFGQIQVDDGVILYLNGAEIYRRNMTNTPANLNYLSLASVTVAGTDETTFWTFLTNASALVNGVNVLAAEVHQSATNSSDIGFNLDLMSNYYGTLPPVVTIASPTNTVTWAAAGVPLLVNARDPEGTVTSVDYFVDGGYAGNSTNVTLSGLWTNPTLGWHYVQAVATDNTGLTADSPAAFFYVLPPPVVTTLINSNSTWRYLDDGSNQGVLWRTNSYNDTGWSNGVAEFGYGDNDEATHVRSNRADLSRIITTYFRKHFNVANLADYSNLVVRLKRDDGGVVYLNGVEIFRSNMTNGPGGPVLFTDLALNAADEVSFFSSNAPASRLRAGDNVVAVEIHQTTASSSDVSFDLQLQAESAPHIFISRSNTVLTVNWLPDVPGFQLQYAPTPTGPWSATPSQANPQSYTTSPADLPTFWRLLVP